MAAKNFGVKQVNLIGASGTPTIESPNNININAVNVAISTDMSVGGSVGISSNLTVSGILTATSFSGDGSGLTGVASTDNIQTATSANFLSNVSVSGIVTATTINVGSGGLQTEFPTDTDYGNLDSVTNDAFGQQVTSITTFDALSEPSKTLSTQDFGALA